MTPRMIGVNERGLRVGQDHQRAKLTDHDVELMRQMREEGSTYAALATMFEVSKSTAYGICHHMKRNQAPSRFKRESATV